MALADNEFVQMVSELLSPLGNIRPNRMFGAFGLYCDGVFFAIIDDDVLYLKGDEQTAGAYDAQGMAPFCVPSGRPMTLSYFEVPGDWLDEPDQLMEFAHMALGAAHRAAAEKVAKAKHKKSKTGSNG